MGRAPWQRRIGGDAGGSGRPASSVRRERMRIGTERDGGRGQMRTAGITNSFARLRQWDQPTASKKAGGERSWRGRIPDGGVLALVFCAAPPAGVWTLVAWQRVELSVCSRERRSVVSQAMQGPGFGIGCRGLRGASDQGVGDRAQLSLPSLAGGEARMPGSSLRCLGCDLDRFCAPEICTRGKATARWRPADRAIRSRPRSAETGRVGHSTQHSRGRSQRRSP